MNNKEISAPQFVVSCIYMDGEDNNAAYVFTDKTVAAKFFYENIETFCKENIIRLKKFDGDNVCVVKYVDAFRRTSTAIFALTNIYE